jgi:hypothetical protein
MHFGQGKMALVPTIHSNRPSTDDPHSGLVSALVEAKLDCAVGDAKPLGEQVEVAIAIVKLTTEVFVGDTAQKAEGWIFP